MDLDSLSGGDPYDALRGEHVPEFVRRTAGGRQAMLQLRKRLPLDLGPALGVRPFTMAKTVSCHLAAAARCGDDGAADDARALLEAMCSTDGHLGQGRWGYEFDVQTRWAFYRRGTPNVIATVFCGRGCLEAWLALGRDEYLDEAIAAAEFIAKDLLVEDGSYFRYLPENDELVHNANALAAGFVAVVGRCLDREDFVSRALDAARSTADAQREDGSWPYGAHDDLRWCDSFHTAYTVDGLHQVAVVSGDSATRDSARLGAAFWSKRFFGDDGEPHYYPDRRYPVDAHCLGTAVDVAARLGPFDPGLESLSRRVWSWGLSEMRDVRTGAWFYRRHRLYRDRRRFPRWVNGHIALADSALSALQDGRLCPIEAMLAEKGGLDTPPPKRSRVSP